MSWLTDQAGAHFVLRNNRLCRSSSGISLRRGISARQAASGPICPDCLVLLENAAEQHFSSGFSQQPVSISFDDMRAAVIAPATENAVEWQSRKHYVIRLSAHGDGGGTPVREWAVPKGHKVTVIAGVFMELDDSGGA